MHICHLTKIQTRQKITRQKVIQVKRVQSTLHVHPQYTVGALQFRLGHGKGRWAHFNVKLHFFVVKMNKFPKFPFDKKTLCLFGHVGRKIKFHHVRGPCRPYNILVRVVRVAFRSMNARFYFADSK